MIESERARRPGLPHDHETRAISEAPSLVRVRKEHLQAALEVRFADPDASNRGTTAKQDGKSTDRGDPQAEAEESVRLVQDVVGSNRSAVQTLTDLRKERLCLWAEGIRLRKQGVPRRPIDNDQHSDR